MSQDKASWAIELSVQATKHPNCNTFWDITSQIQNFPAKKNVLSHEMSQAAKCLKYKRSKPQKVLVWCLLYLYDVYWLGRWLLLTGSKYLEYISRIRILNNNWTMLLNWNLMKQSFELNDLTKERNWIELECKVNNKCTINNIWYCEPS